MLSGRRRATELAPGDSVGPYVLEALLGEGGMGVVFRARRDDDEPVALKVLRPELSSDETYCRRFMHEARAAAEVVHHHLVPVLEAGKAGGYHYLAVAYVGGASLEAHIRAAGALAPGEIAHIAGGVASGLDALHEAGLVHRDVKPSNIMLDEEGDAMLTDFGLARGRGYTVLTRPGQVMGTLDYIAPELIRGQPASPASDLYALGCTMYECVTGQPPFASKSAFEAATAHLEEDPPDPVTVRPDVPASLAWAVLQGLAKDPARRPATATGYAHLLAAAAPSRR